MRIIAGNTYRQIRQLSVQDVTDALNGFDRSTHEFWPDDITITDGSTFSTDHIHGAGQLTDIYLLALAVKNGGRFVTSEGKIKRTLYRRNLATRVYQTLSGSREEPG